MGKESKEMNSMYRWIIIVPGIVTVLLAICIKSSAQIHEGFIYGKVYLDDRTTPGRCAGEMKKYCGLIFSTPPNPEINMEKWCRIKG
jgi:hypothetical protein